MPSLTYDDSSFAIDGKRIWLVSGSVHYFRTPAALWRDRLLKAKRAGLNCISTYVAWNFHEAVEGKWDFSGDRDIAEYVRLAGELGLYVILRPGPYICAEWDFGGLPSWLTTKTGIAYRTSNAAFMHYFDKYFRQVLPRLAEFQVTRGGNIVLIQNENEYLSTTMPDRLNYLEFISQLFRRSGFDIPIVTCNSCTEPALRESIECVNAWSQAIQQLKRVHHRQHRSPLLVTEFWPGWFDSWSQAHQTRDARETARRALEILGCGAQCNYYMFHGGTNFGFWGSRHAESDNSYQTTSYDFDAPLAEGGGFSEKYYLTRLVNLTANHMGAFLAAAMMDEQAATIHDGTAVLSTSSSAGRWAVVTNNGRDEFPSARISLPSGRELTVSLEVLGATLVPISVRLAPAIVLDYSNLTPLGLFADRLLVLHGPAGWQGEFSINGREHKQIVPAGHDHVLVESDALSVLVINSATAMRTWPVGEHLVLGPDFVGETIEQMTPASDRACTVMTLDGKVVSNKPLPAAGSHSRPPQLGRWSRISVCTEPADASLEWQKLDRPKDVDRLGIPHGYVWYRCEFNESKARKRKLFLSDCEDRATLYLNHELIGTWGRGDGAVRQPIAAGVRKGANVLVALVDNLGRLNYGTRLGEPKGLWGEVYDCKPLPIKKVKLKEQTDFSRRLVPRHLAHLAGELEAGPVRQADLVVPLTSVQPIHISFNDLPGHVVILCNERVAGFFVNHGRNYGDVTLGPELRKGKNVLKIMLWGDVSEKTLAQIHFNVLQECVTEGGRWAFRPWTMPREQGPIIGKDSPAWYSTTFKYSPSHEPLFLHLIGARKGQIFLNGHDAGRFWTIGPQQHYYLPECWLKEENELMIFEESGRIPAGSQLSFRPRGPYRD